MSLYYLNGLTQTEPSLQYMGDDMKPHVFAVELEPDESGWLVTCPSLEQYAAYTWGRTEAEALANIGEVIGMILEELVESGVPTPQEAARSDLAGNRQRVEVSV